MPVSAAPPARDYPLVAENPHALGIVMPFTASPREVEALGPWDRRLAWLFTCDPRAHERALELGFHAILHRGATAASLRLGSDKPFVRDMIEALLAAAPGMAWYGIANCDIRLCPHAFAALCRANIYHRIYHKKHAMGYSLHSEEAAYNRRLLRNDPYWKHYWERREFFSHEAHRHPGQLPVHYAEPGG